MVTPQRRDFWLNFIRLPQYSWDNCRRDLVAGLTVAAVSLPQAIAYALIAGVDPRFGVYSAIIVAAVASIFGSSSHLINGPTSAISLLVFSALGFIDPADHGLRFESLFVLGVLVGALQILIAVARLGKLASYISDSVVMGFVAAAALLLALGQTGNALGIKDKGNATMHVLYRLWLTLAHGDRINYRAVILSVAAIAVVVGVHWVVRRYGWPQIDLLAALIAMAGLAFLMGWSLPRAAGKTTVAVATMGAQGLPRLHIPAVDPDTMSGLWHGVIVIAFVGIVEALSIARAIANHTGQKIDYNRQILAEGMANVTGGFCQCLPGSGSLSRSAINFHAGAVSRFSGMVSALAVAVAFLLFAPLLRYVPTAALAGLLLVTAVRLVDVPRLLATVRSSGPDAVLVLVTFVTGVAVDLDKAIVVGFGMSLLIRAVGAVRRRWSRAPGTHRDTRAVAQVP